ncbi:DUF6894 family protein [Tardiphaga sp. 768_D3_N2_1]|uniref:DUF6894 family protein n=1 Tax=Tardiphaga sp. 768_D3_N2_1 TaxID=3240783 RepID=UPI003F8A1704
MTRYFFPLLGGIRLSGDSGIDLPNRRAAIEHAARIARGGAKGTPNYAGPSRFVVVINESGEEVFRAPVQHRN